MRSKDHFTVLFIGLGSIGKRHLRVLREIAHIKALRIKSDLSVSSDEIKDVEVCESIEHAVDKHPDFAIIATPSAYHLKPAMEMAEAGIPFIVENLEFTKLLT